MLTVLTKRTTLPFAALMVTGLLLADRPSNGQTVPPPTPAADPGAPDGDDAEDLIRGPLHEAFAEPVNYNPGPGLTTPKQPPEAINELPPEVKPNSDAIWIPGYWAWDDERNDYLWVSGVYRVEPPGRRWVPGFWGTAPDGYQWTPGFWASIEAAEVDYLPNPPESLESGPSSPAPSDDYFWVNGCWIFANGGYSWRAGYWAVGYDDWVWVPAHYAWSPYGCIYVPGYWDYQLAYRGMCFAPVYFRRPIYRRAGYYYWPRHVIDLSILDLHLFVRPRYCHYYFGDWYGGRYDRWGIYASFNFHGGRGYDPLWTHRDWYFHRRGIDYGGRIRGWHVYFDKHEDMRPRHTWRDQQQFVAQRHGQDHIKQIVLANDVKDVVSRHSDRFQRINDNQRQEMRKGGLELNQVIDARRHGGDDHKFGDHKGPGPGDRSPGNDRSRGQMKLKLPDTPHVKELRQRRDFDRSPRNDGPPAQMRDFPNTGSNRDRDRDRQPDGRRDMPQLSRDRSDSGLKKPDSSRGTPMNNGPQIQRERPQTPQKNSNANQGQQQAPQQNWNPIRKRYDIPQKNSSSGSQQQAPQQQAPQQKSPQMERRQPQTPQRSFDNQRKSPQKGSDSSRGPSRKRTEVPQTGPDLGRSTPQITNGLSRSQNNRMTSTPDRSGSDSTRRTPAISRRLESVQKQSTLSRPQVEPRSTTPQTQQRTWNPQRKRYDIPQKSSTVERRQPTTSPSSTATDRRQPTIQKNSSAQRPTPTTSRRSTSTREEQPRTSDSSKTRGRRSSSK